MFRGSPTPSELPCEVAPSIDDRDDLHPRSANAVGNRYPPLHRDCTQPRKDVVAVAATLGKFRESHAGCMDSVDVVVLVGNLRELAELDDGDSKPYGCDPLRTAAGLVRFEPVTPAV